MYCCLIFSLLFSPFAILYLFVFVLYFPLNHNDFSPVLFYSQNTDITIYLKYSYSIGYMSIFVFNSVLWVQTCVLWVAPTQAVRTYISRSLLTYLYMYFCMYSPCINWNMSNKLFWSWSWSSPVFPLTKASDAELRCFLWPEPEQTAEQTIETPVIWDAISLIMTALYWKLWLLMVVSWHVDDLVWVSFYRVGTRVPEAGRVKPVRNGHLYNKMYYLWFIQRVLMVTDGTNLLVLTIIAF